MKTFVKKRKPFLLASNAPCAHCGSPFNFLICHGNARHDGTPFNLMYQVTCEQCRASGPIAKTAQEAIAAWGHDARTRTDEKATDQVLEFELGEAKSLKAVKGWEHHAQPLQNETPPVFMPDIECEETV